MSLRAKMELKVQVASVLPVGRSPSDGRGTGPASSQSEGETTTQFNEGADHTLKERIIRQRHMQTGAQEGTVTYART